MEPRCRCRHEQSAHVMGNKECWAVAKPNSTYKTRCPCVEFIPVGENMDQVIIDESTYPEGNFIISASVSTRDETTRDAVYEKFAKSLFDVAHHACGSTLAWYPADKDDENENYSVFAVFKVANILKEKCGLNSQQAWECIEELHKAGVVFKPR